MRKLMMLGMCALAISFVGCSKASKAESLLREGMRDNLEKEIQKKLAKFKKMTPEEQDKEIKKAEEELKGAKKMAEALK